MNRLRIDSKLYLWCITIISANFFGLYNIVSKYTQIYFTDAMAILLILCSCIYLGLHLSNDMLRIPKKRKIDRYAILFLLWIVLEILISYFKYSSTQNMVSTIKESLYFIAPILVFYSVKKIIKNEEILDYYVDILIKVSLICSILAILALMIYTNTGKNMLGLNTDDYSFIRNGRGHFMVGSMVVVPATLFLWCRIITGELKIFGIITLLVNLFHIIYVGQTRMQIAIVLVVMVLSYLVVSKRSKKLKAAIIFFLICVLLLMGMQTINEYMTELLGNNSVTYRLEGIYYYLGQIVKHPFFGMGFISSSNTKLSTLLFGPLLRFFRTDVGLIGFVNCFGIVGGLWYLSYINYGSRLVIKCKSRLSIKMYEYVFSFAVFLILSSINLFPLDGYRMLYFSISMILLHLVEIKQSNIISNN